MNRPHDAGWLYWVGMNVFTHPFNSFVSRRFFWGINYMQAASPAIRAWGIQKKTHRHRTVTPPKQRRRLFVRLPVCAGVWESGDASRQLGIGKIGVPWKGLEVERLVGFSEDPWERWHIYLSVYIYIIVKCAVSSSLMWLQVASVACDFRLMPFASSLRWVAVWFLALDAMLAWLWSLWENRLCCGYLVGPDFGWLDQPFNFDLSDHSVVWNCW